MNSRVFGVVALFACLECVSSAGFPNFTNCLVSYASSKCEGEASFQTGYSSLTEDYGTPLEGACNAGPYKNLAGEAFCRALITDWEATCSEDMLRACQENTNCSLSSCALCAYASPSPTTPVWACPAANEPAAGIHITPTKMAPQESQQACQHMAQGAGWRFPVLANLSDYSHSLSAVVNYLTQHGADEPFFVDGVRTPPEPEWRSVVSGEMLDLEPYWGPNEPKEGSTYVAVEKRDNATHGTQYYLVGVTEEEEYRSVCTFVQMEVVPSTPPPTPAPQGSCKFLDKTSGQTLSAEAKSAQYTTLSDAQEACCALGTDNMTCIGLIEDKWGQFTLGTGNASGNVTEGWTYTRLMPEPVEPVLVHTGMSPVIIGVLIAGVVLTFYCAIGMSMKAQQGETSCPDILPNAEFWSACPGMVFACGVAVCRLDV